MAFSEAGTVVIDNVSTLPTLKNLSYSDLKPIISSSGAPSIDFGTSLIHWNMTVAATATVTHPAGAGSTVLVLLDRDSAGYAPTWSGVDAWPQGQEPTWSNYRYWHVSIVRWGDNTTRASAVGFSA